MRAFRGSSPPDQLRPTLAAKAISRGMSLNAIATLLGHKILAMAMVYARIADETVAHEYFAVIEKVEALYDQPRHLDADDEGAEMRKLRAEMLPNARERLLRQAGRDGLPLRIDLRILLRGRRARCRAASHRCQSECGRR
jgi:hypothetical protein